MCDQIEIRSLNGGQTQFCSPCDYSTSSDQFGNVETSPYEFNKNYSVQCKDYSPTQNQQGMDYSQAQNQQSYEKCPPGYQLENIQEPPQICYQPPSFSPSQQMCYQPPDCMPFYQPQSCGPEQLQCDPFFQRCDPCEPRLGPCSMPCEDDCLPPRFQCPPLDTCSPMCSPYRKGHYVQPLRRESCKPIIKYQRPSIPMTSDTMYKKSFDFIDAQTAASCRMPPVYPIGQLQSPRGEFAKETVTKLSFQRNCCAERTRPIYPASPSLLGQGPMQELTTQKHDFVPKFQLVRTICVPQDNIHRGCGDIERDTVQRLSFMRPEMCKFVRAESCKPVINYRPPELPMEFETTQKLSFMPVCPAPKEEFPWARKAQYCPPTMKFAKDTVARLSFQPPGCFTDNDC